MPTHTSIKATHHNHDHIKTTYAYTTSLKWILIEDQVPVDYGEGVKNNIVACVSVTQPKVLFVEDRAFAAVMRLPNILPTTSADKSRKRVDTQSNSLEFHDRVLTAKFRGLSTPLPRGCSLLFFSLFAIGPFLASLAAASDYEALQFDPPRDYGTAHEDVRREME